MNDEPTEREWLEGQRYEDKFPTEYEPEDCMLEWSEEGVHVIDEEHVFNAFQMDSYIVRGRFPNGLCVYKCLERGARGKGVREDPEYARQLRIYFTHMVNAGMARHNP